MNNGGGEIRKKKMERKFNEMNKQMKEEKKRGMTGKRMMTKRNDR